jgi:signal transduction histidine kinase
MWKYRRYLLPAALGLMGLLLLARLFFINSSVLVPEDIDIVLLVVLLSVTMVTAIHTIVRISMNYLRLLSVQHARRETLAEHSRFLLRLDHVLKNPLTTLRAGFIRMFCSKQVLIGLFLNRNTEMLVLPF